MQKINLEIKLLNVTITEKDITYKIDNFPTYLPIINIQIILMDVKVPPYITYLDFIKLMLV